jgi:hypothetical protein
VLVTGLKEHQLQEMILVGGFMRGRAGRRRRIGLPDKAIVCGLLIHCCASTTGKETVEGNSCLESF